MCDGQALRVSPDSVTAMQQDVSLSMGSPLKVGDSFEAMRAKMTQMPGGGVAPASQGPPVTPTSEEVIHLAVAAAPAPLDPSLSPSPQKLGFQLQYEIQLHGGTLHTFACQFVDTLISSSGAAASVASTVHEAQERNGPVLSQ